MNEKKIIQATINALSEINNPRLFKTERGYQGEFYCQLKSELTANETLSGDRMLEMEYQKSRSEHDGRKRPDILLHIPVEISGARPNQNNFVVWALKREGKVRGIKKEIINFHYMFNTLNYQFGIFLNINSDNSFKEKFEKQFQGKVISFAVKLENGIPIIYQ